MNHKRILFLSVLLLAAIIIGAGCNGSSGGPTGPANAPSLFQNSVQVNPSPASSGAIITFSIDFVDVPGDLNGGTAVISMVMQSPAYQKTDYGLISNAAGTSGTLLTSIELDPTVPSGTLNFTIFVQDQAGNSSNNVYASITVL